MAEGREIYGPPPLGVFDTLPKPYFAKLSFNFNSLDGGSLAKL